MKCTNYTCLLLAQFICHAVYCQYYFSSRKTEPELLWEAGAAAGVWNCLTDVGGANGKGRKFIKDINWNQTQLGAGLFVSAAWHYQFTIRLELAIGRIAGSDKVLNNSAGIARNRYLRNLQFRTSIAEGTLLGELYPLLLADKNREISFLSPYLTAGIGLFNYTPQASVNGAWIKLRPLHTEGEGFSEYPGRAVYKPITWCIPLGAGIKYDAAGLIDLRFEILYRFTGTDYLDDVSTKYIDPSLFSKYLSPVQSVLAEKLADRTAEITAGYTNNIGDKRGNPGNKDAYFSFMLKMSIVLGRVQRK